MNTSLPMQFSLKDELDNLYMDPTMRRIRESQMMGQPQQPQQPAVSSVQPPDFSNALSGMIAATQQQQAQRQAEAEAASQKQMANLVGAGASILGAGMPSTAGNGAPAAPPAAPLDTTLPGGTPTVAGAQLDTRMQNPSDVLNTAPGTNPTWADKLGNAWDNYKAGVQAKYNPRGVDFSKTLGGYMPEWMKY